MKAVALIQAEHRNLGAMLMCLESLVRAIDASKAEPDFRLLGAVHDYLENFLERCHHPKEDQYLLPALQRRADDAESLILRVREEHEIGARMLDALRGSLDGFASAGRDRFVPYRDKALDYIAFERRHALREERVLLPLLLKRLPPHDWEMIDAAFAENDDPVFGCVPSGHFEQLSKLVMETALFGRPVL